MAKIKLYTDLEQSKKLAEILPLESADGFWEYHNEWYSEGDEWEGYEDYPRAEPYLEYTRKENEWKEDKSDIPCWSLAALLDVLSEIKPQVYTTILFPSEGKWILQFAEYGHGNVCEVTCDNPVDACVAIIEKLHELNLL